MLFDNSASCGLTKDSARGEENTTSFEFSSFWPRCKRESFGDNAIDSGRYAFDLINKLVKEIFNI